MEPTLRLKSGVHALMAWPTMDEFMRAAALPEGVTLRAWTDAEVSTLPGLLRTWYPTIGVGAEWPTDAQLTPRSRAALALLFPR